ncbi:unnamed protein product [Chrysoparadoxa australica]
MRSYYRERLNEATRMRAPRARRGITRTRWVFTLLVGTLLLFVAQSQVVCEREELVAADMNPFEEKLRGGLATARIHAPSHLTSSCTALIFGVGTAMTTNDYDQLAAAIAARGFAVIVVDPQNHYFPKNSPQDLSEAMQEVKAKLVAWLAPTSRCADGAKRWIVGGHSSSGGAAHSALVEDSSLADGAFSLDPFAPYQLQMLSKPGVYWGLDAASCFVRFGGRKAYEVTEKDHRVLHIINQQETGFGHCAFTDNGCPGWVGLCSKGTPGLFKDIAQSFERYITALESGEWETRVLDLKNATNPITTCVNVDVEP